MDVPGACVFLSFFGCSSLAAARRRSQETLRPSRPTRKEVTSTLLRLHLKMHRREVAPAGGGRKADFHDHRHLSFGRPPTRSRSTWRLQLPGGREGWPRPPTAVLRGVGGGAVHLAAKLCGRAWRHVRALTAEFPRCKSLSGRGTLAKGTSPLRGWGSLMRSFRHSESSPSRPPVLGTVIETEQLCVGAKGVARSPGGEPCATGKGVPVSYEWRL